MAQEQGAIANQYTQSGQFHFRNGTPDKIKRIISSAPKGRRYRFHFGDVVTGKVWLEEHDVIGTIGRSTGSIKVPLLIEARQDGGGELSTCSICAIQDISTKEFIYKVDGLQLPELIIKGQPYPDKPEYTAGVYQNNILQAAFKTDMAACNYVLFMRGERMRVN